MQIPSVPPRREPPRVTSLKDLKKYCRAVTVSAPVKFYLSYIGCDERYRLMAYIGEDCDTDILISSDRASHFICSYVWHAVRGASKEF